MSVSACVSILYGQNNSRHIIAPVENDKVFVEGDQKYTYQVYDEVFVSIGFISHRNGEYVFDMTIDNQSEDTLEFDPGEIHLFRYAQDTLAEKRIYYAQNPELVLDSIDFTIDDKKDKIRNNTFLSLVLSALYITTEIAGFNEEMDYGTIEAIRFGHDLSQIGLGIAREEKAEKIYELEYAGDYWLKGTIQHCVVPPNTYESGRIHFKVPQSEILKIYVPIDSRIYRYTFQDVALK